MGVTAITGITNRSDSDVILLDIENPDAPGHGDTVAPGGSHVVDMWIPWAPRQADFAGKHIRLLFGGVPRFWIWQAHNRDGDRVRFSTDGAWHDCGEPVDGMSGVDGPRTLVVYDDGFQLVDIPDELLGDLLR